MRKYCFFTLLLLVALVLAIYSVNFYFLSRLSSQIRSRSSYEDQIDNDEQSSDDQIRLKAVYRNRNPKYAKVKDSLVRNYMPCTRDRDFNRIWSEADAVSCDIHEIN
jgi:hypothetical protein